MGSAGCGAGKQKIVVVEPNGKIVVVAERTDKIVVVDSTG
jgi:hypothetical protein